MESIFIFEKELFDCDVCEKTFVRKDDLECHYLCHSDEKPFHIIQRSYLCDVCGKDFCKIKYLNRHRRIHTGEKRYECEVCHKKFSECGNLQKHRRLHTGYRPFACKFCDKKYSRKDQLQYHLIHHTNEKPFTCDLCQKKFAFPRQLELHHLTHANEKPYPCNECGKTFLNPSTLKRHTLIHTGEKPFVCDVCSKGFSTSNNLKIHRETHIYKSSVKGNISQITFSKIHHPVRKRPFECKKCKQSFIYKSNLTRHLLIHGEKNFVCAVCKKRFRRKDDLKCHSLTHSTEKPFVCNYCPKRFCDPKYLRIHMRFHTGEKRYQCDECKIRFFTSGNLNKHKQTRAHKKAITPVAPHKHLFSFQKNTPSNENIFPDISLTKVAASNYLKLYKYIYKGEKPYECKVCQKIFIFKRNLVQHESEHASEKSFGSEFCEENLSSVSTLKNPTFNNIDEKALIPDITLKEFSGSNYLKFSEREKLYECKKCQKIFFSISNLDKHKLDQSCKKAPISAVFEESSSSVIDLKNQSSLNNSDTNLILDTNLREFSVSNYLKLYKCIYKGEKPYECKKCQKRFFSKSNLEKHELKNLCEKAFSEAIKGNSSSVGDLKNRVSDSANEINLILDFTQEQFTDSNYLENYQSSPDGEKSYDECKEPEDKFCNKSSQDEHQFEHSNEKKFNSETCEESSSIGNLKNEFSDSNFVQLTARESSSSGKDLKNQPFLNATDTNLVIDTNLREFSVSNYLKLYKRMYKGEKPDECKKCQKIFFSKSKLENHELKNLCEKAFSEAITGNSSSVGDLKNRVSDSANEINLILDFTQEQFTDSNYLRNYQSSPHGEKSYDECKEPEEKFCNKSSQDEQQFEHSSGKNFNSEACKESSSISNLKIEFSDSNFAQLNAREKYECETCFKRFVFKHSLDKHSLIHNGFKPFACSLCQERFYFKNDLRCHIAIHRNKSPYTCDICWKVCCRSTDLKRHLRTHTGLKPFECEMCHKKFSDGGNLRRHYIVHTGERPFTCTVCEKSFGRKGTLKMHLLTHTIEKPFVCEHCEKEFASPLQLEKHLTIHTGLRYECKACKKQYTSISKVRFHSDCIARNGGKPFICEFCKKVFCTPNGIKFHHNMHIRGNNVTCDICGIKLSSKKYLKVHLNMHKDKKPYQCDKCPRGFITRYNLKRHLLIHKREKNFACFVCMKRFFTINDLKTHKTHFHLQERPHVCDLCNRKFSCAKYLEIHSRIHKSEKKIYCDKCREIFANQESLEEHLKTHRQEKSEIIFQTVYGDKISQGYIRAKTVEEPCVILIRNEIQDK